MDKILSISRSGDLDKGGNALKSRKVQSEFFAQIEHKINDYLRDFPYESQASNPAPAQLAAQENILIQLRKLREGLLSTKRSDLFALQVYELSFYFAVASHSTTHMQSTANTLPGLYRSSTGPVNPQTSKDKRQGLAFAIIRLLQSLTETESLGSRYHNRLKEIKSFCQLDSSSQAWMQELFSSIIKGNFVQSMLFTDSSQVETRIIGLGLNGDTSTQIIAKNALTRTLLDLRDVLRLRVWTILRTAYRQVTIPFDDWCRRSLGFEDDSDMEDWLRGREKLDEVCLKPGSTSIWILRRPKR